MMKGVPKSVRVGPHDIKIRVIPDKELGDDFGTMEMAKLEMTLSESYAAGSMAVDTTLHEILHVIWHLCLREVGAEEQIVSAMASQFTQVMRDNPELIAWMQKTVQK